MQQRSAPACDRCGQKAQCMAEFSRVVKKHGGRMTQEREVVLQTICNMTGHFAPEALLQAARQHRQDLSLATLYRNLPLLEEAGILRRATMLGPGETGAQRYEAIARRPHHDHLVCQRCGRVVEFEYPAIEVLQEAVARDHGFQLVRHHLELLGVCPGCQSAERGDPP